MTSKLSSRAQSNIGLIILAYIAFISLGLPDGLLGVAWPSIRTDFRLSLAALGPLLLATMTGYLVSSFFSGRTMARLGVGGLLTVSCAMTGAALIGYTLVPSWWMFIALGVMAGLGAGAIDAGINTYIASNYSEGLMQWLHASFGLGVTLGPIIMTTGMNLFEAWRPGYLVVGSAQLLLALSFALTASMWKQPRPVAAGEPESSNAAQRLIDYQTSLWDTVRQPRTWLSVLIFFVYTGVEVTLGLWAYTLLTEGRGIAPEVAGLWAGGYWGSFTLGRVLAGLYTRRISVHTLVRGSLLLGLVGAALVWWNPSDAVSLFGVALVGFAIAPVFPGLVSGTSGRVSPEHAANTIGMQVSAAGLGGAVLPGVAGALAERLSLEVIPVYLAFWFAALLGLYALAIRLGKNKDKSLT